MYLENNFPIEKVYDNPSYLEKAKRLVSALLETQNPVCLTKDHGIGKEIQVIRPDNKKSKWIINQCAFHNNLYRIDYGNTPFRIVFGIVNDGRRAYIFAFDTEHKTYESH